MTALGWLAIGLSGVSLLASQPPKKQQPLLEFSGRVESVAAGKLILAMEDGRQLDFTCTKETKFFREEKPIEAREVRVGAEVTIEARQNDESFLFAVNVRLYKDAPVAGRAEARAPASSPETRQPSTTMAPPPSVDPEDAGPPQTRRGKPERVVRAERSAAKAPPPPPPRAGAPMVVLPEEPAVDPRVAKAREVAEEFTGTLPNYLVQQFATRYWSDSAKVNWRALDVLSAVVVYEGGKESYRNVKINNRATKQAIDELRGTVSRGEFGTTLVDLLSKGTNAQFFARGSSTVSGLPAWCYDFRVELPNSHWLTRVGSQSIRPAYKGAVWLDRNSFRVLRIEMQARNLPGDYPLDVIEWVVEYGNVRLGDREFLVPTHAEVMACWRGTSKCSRNSTEFRNYRRFTGESDIYATESTVDFGKEPPPPAPPKKP